MIHVRIATAEDAELIADLSHQTFRESFAEFNTEENMNKFMVEQFNKPMLKREVGAPRNIFLLAYDDDEPVGYARLRENNIPPELKEDEAFEIARIYAVKNSIGKGVGKALMSTALNIAAEKKFKTVWLGVWEHNTRAIDFYKRWGFEKFSIHPFILGEDVQTDWLMKKTM
jgi:diamine N-acetyltransferase